MKVQGAMALLQGVQELATIATGNSALKTMVLDGAQKAVAASARVMGVSVAQATAIMTAGLSLVVAGVAYLVSEIAFAGEETNRVTDKMLESQKELLSFQEDITKKKIALIKDEKAKELVLEHKGKKTDFQLTDLVHSRDLGQLFYNAPAEQQENYIRSFLLVSFY